MGARMESDMRQDLFDHFQRLSFSYYDRNNTGEMMSKLVSDLFDISELAHHGPENIFISLLKIVGSFALLLWINVPMTLILAAVTLIMLLFCIDQNKKMRAVFMDNRRKIAGVNARVQDSLAGIRVVKSFANEDLERQKFQKSNLQFLDSKGGITAEWAVTTQGITYSRGFCLLQCLFPAAFCCARRYIGDRFSRLRSVHQYFYQSDRRAHRIHRDVPKGYSGFKRFLEVVETQPEIIDAPDAQELAHVHGEIDYQNVSFRYDDSGNVLNHVDIHIRAGETVALVGPSGGGKTTLCSLLPRFYDVTGGSVSIDGKDVRSLTLKSLRSAIGIVQQDVYMFGGTIRDNIAYGKPNASMEEIIQAAKNANIHEFITSLPDGYDTDVGERGTRLSGGQKTTPFHRASIFKESKNIDSG